MRKRIIPVFLAGLLAVGVCTACHSYESQSVSGPEIERVDAMPSKEVGPTLSKKDVLEETVPVLELEEDKEKAKKKQNRQQHNMHLKKWKNELLRLNIVFILGFFI